MLLQTKALPAAAAQMYIAMYEEGEEVVPEVPVVANNSMWVEWVQS